MATPRARTVHGQRGGDTAITVKRDVLVDEDTGLMAERKSVEAADSKADDGSEGARTVHGVSTEEQLRPIRPYTAFRRNAGYHRVMEEEDEEEENHKPRRSFCRSWCEIWFLVAQSRISCSIFTVVLFVIGAALILITSLGGITDCQPLTGAAVFCFLMAILTLSIACLCCCYHWVRDDEDLPFAIFCTAYCLLLLFIFTLVAGSTAVYTHVDIIVDGNYTKDGNIIPCDMTSLPVVVMALTYVVGIGFVGMSFVAFVLAMGATT